MPFPFCFLMFSYAIWQSSIERAFDFNPASAPASREICREPAKTP
jgi:hypothetical protein